ncbi:MAG: phytanoyl-CoA dioxygenase family protein [Acidimicrobiales bacterium]|nr:phytanoyl-CoA dioxygenase family protein [Acidimicrobiales bacterium]
MLTAGQLAAWERDGYIVMLDAVDPAACDTLREHVMADLAAADPSVDGGLTVFDTTEQGHAQDEYFLTSGDKVRWFLEDGAVVDGQLTRPLPLAVNKLAHAMHDLDPKFDEFSRTPLLAGVATDLGIADPKLLQSMYIFKQPSIGGEVSCHCDHTFLWTEPQSVIGYWFAIEDATLENGCLWVAPGHHRDPVRTRFRREGNGTTMDVLDTAPWPTDELVPIEATKGTMVVLHGSLPHWSAPNTSDMSRHAYTLHVIDGAADYPVDNWLHRASDMPLRGF